MSSKKSSSKKSQKKTNADNQKEGDSQNEPKMPVSLNKNGEIILTIHAKPGAKQNSITDMQPEAIGVQIAAPPVDGEANTELIRYIANVLHLRKSDVSIDRGSKSREKKLIIGKKDLNINEIMNLLKTEFELSNSN